MQCQPATASLGSLAGAGLRQGEALGLTVDRVDFLRRQLRVDRQLQTPGRGQPSLEPPKSPASMRVVPLADVVLEALAEHARNFPVGPDGLLVTFRSRSRCSRDLTAACE